MVKELQSLGLDVRVLDKAGSEITLKDYADDEGEDEKKISDEELGKSVLENTDDVIYDDELGANDDEETDGSSDSEEDGFSYDSDYDE